jgi:hypothetical protein
MASPSLVRGGRSSATQLESGYVSVRLLPVVVRVDFSGLLLLENIAVHIAVRECRGLVAMAVAIAVSRVPVRECGAFLSFVYFGAIDHDAAWRLDSEAYLVAYDTQYRDSDFVPDVDGLYGASRENQHAASFQHLLQ